MLSRFVYGSRAHVPDYMVQDTTTYRLVTDERGSVRLVIDAATGGVAQSLTYDPWGRVTSDTNPGFQPLGYAGGLTDPDTALVRFGRRDYDPAATQWLPRDTIGFTGGTNHYAYADGDGDPINRIDPTGHSALGCLADVLGLLGMIPVIGAVFDVASALTYFEVDAAVAGDNAALLLRGVRRDQVRRGQVVCAPGSVEPHQRFTAQVYALTAEEGGRHTPFFGNYRPQFFFRTTSVVGAVDLGATEMVLPGDTVELTVELGAPVALAPGQGFAIREGGRTVGAGTVTRVLG